MLGRRNNRPWTRERFNNSLSSTETGCCLWLGTQDKAGYGRTALKGTKEQLAHRVAWLLNRGAIPTGMHILHTCDVRNCCNTEHMFLGSHQDNMTDKKHKGRIRVGSRPGVAHHNAKLADADVILIRLWRDLGHSCGELATIFNVDSETVRGIGLRTSWKHVP